MYRRLHLLLPATLVALFLALSGCAQIAPTHVSWPGVLHTLLPSDMLLLGERHDAPQHQQMQREAVEWLTRQGLLAALVLEMAEQGHGTQGLPRDASESAVQAALAWNDGAWPWQQYGPVAMAAVRAGVPVLGANMPRARMKDAMADVSLDAQLSDAARAMQEEAVRSGHCNLLPASQIAPMTRIQIARDRAMAQTVVKARQPGKTVLLVAGSGHTLRTLGVPQHLPTDVKVATVQLLAADKAPSQARADFDAVWLTPPLPAKDYCAGVLKRTS